MEARSETEFHSGRFWVYGFGSDDVVLRVGG